MAGKVVTVDGREWLSGQMAPGNAQEKLSKVGVGEGTTDPDESDDSLEGAEIYIATNSGSDVSVDTTGNVGQVRATIEVTGGTDFTAGKSVTEFGTLTEDDVLFHREVRATGVEIASGETVTFEIIVNLEDIN